MVVHYNGSINSSRIYDSKIYNFRSVIMYKVLEVMCHFSSSVNQVWANPRSWLKLQMTLTTWQSTGKYPGRRSKPAQSVVHYIS